MPVAIKFSQGFYDRFGHEAVDELVNYLNRVDSGYRSELKDLNEANFARFDDKLERRVAELRAEIELRVAELRVEMATRFAATDAQFERLRREITAARGDMIKWMFVFIATAVLVILGWG